MKIVPKAPEPRDPRIESSKAQYARAAFKARAEKAESTARSGVTIASSLNGASAAHGAQSGIDLAKVERLRSALADGSIQPDTQAIAKSIAENN
jgi:flagellar biosynthesis anti-sigma factor FlgM